jgi:Phage integrase family
MSRHQRRLTCAGQPDSRHRATCQPHVNSDPGGNQLVKIRLPLTASPPPLPCSSGPTAPASPAAPCNTESCAKLKKAGRNGERPTGALVHGLRHTFATELVNANVSVYTLMKLLGHESMATSQRYVDGAGADTRTAAELNPLYELLSTERRQETHAPTTRRNDSPHVT